MSELVPLVVGGALTLIGGAGTEWLRDRRASNQATTERLEIRQERRDDLERQTLTELQDSLQTYVRGIAKVRLFDEKTQREHGQQFQIPDGLDAELNAGQVLTIKLATRVADDEIRRLVDEVIQHGTATVLPDPEEPQRHWKEMGGFYERAQEKIGRRLRSL
jgi:hypothetical protein